VFLPDSIVVVDGIRTSFGWYRHRGLRLRGILFEPAPKRFADGRHPAIVFNHGGVSGISRDVIARARELARRGYVVFTPSYRGEDGSDGRIEVAHGEVDDVLGAFEILAARSDVDSTRIGMLGSSHGALITVLAMSREPRIRAGVAAYGVMNIETWYRWLVANDIDVSDTLSVRIYGSGPDDRPEVFRARNATLVAGRIRAPLLIVQGRKDRTVPAHQAVEFGAALKALKHRDHKVKIYPLLGHNFLFWTTPGFHTPAEMREAAGAWRDVTRFLDRKVKRSPFRSRFRR
jgi:dipeptidyl aminopeptidase/acylaminoacyl peptidase